MSSATVGANLAPQQQQQQQQVPFTSQQQPPRSGSTTQAQASFSANGGGPPPPPPLPSANQSPAMSAPTPAAPPAPSPAPGGAQVVSSPVTTPAAPASATATTTTSAAASPAITSIPTPAAAATATTQAAQPVGPPPPGTTTTGTTTAVNTPVLTPRLAPVPAPLAPAAAASHAQEQRPQQHPHPQAHQQQQQQQQAHHAPPPHHHHPHYPPSLQHSTSQPLSVPPPSGPISQAASQQHSFSMSQPSPSLMAAPPSYRRSFSDMSARFSNEGPGIYSAVYSGVDVYEMEVNNVAVMRRRADSWLNATQILKVAGVDKGKRTKILEKEIQTGEHEKVQGGYGKYQGTWIKFERGFEVCQQYGVEEILRPLLTYDMGQDGGVAGRGDINTPTKEQAMAAQRKRTMYASHDPRNGAVSSTFFKSISTTASQAVAAMSKGRFDPSGMRNRLPSSQPAPPRPSFSRQSSMQNADDGPPNSQQSVATEYSAAGGAGGGGGLGNGGGAGGVDPSFGPQGHASGPGGGAVDDQPPRKKQRTTTPAGGSFGYGHGPDGVAAAGGYAGGAYPPPSPTELNDSFYNPSGHGVAAAGGDVLSGRSLPPMQYEDTPEAENVRQQIIQLFVSPDSATDELVSRLSPAQADMPIDSLRNTALHYAASLPRVRVLAMLVALGGNVWRANAEGDTPLMRAVMVTNPFEASVFPELLDITGGTLEARDNKGRTVLHKIALASGLKGRAGSSKYYFESLLEWIVRSGNLQPSTSTAAAAAAASGPKHRASQAPHAMTLARFINEIVDAQDDNGDTALMLAARLKNKSIISQLLEVGADPNIANRSGLRPTTFGVGSPSDKAHGEALALAEANGEPGPQRSKEVADNVQAALGALLADTFSTSQHELKAKQDAINGVHAELEALSARLSDAHRRVDAARARIEREKLDRQRISNLSQARENFQKSVADKDDGTSADPKTQPISAWDSQLSTLLDAARASTSTSPVSAASMLPPSHVLRARIKALASRRDDTNHMAAAMRSRSRETEDKYRKLVSLCDMRGLRGDKGENAIDNDLDALLKAVESESGADLEVNRVRRFLGTVEDKTVAVTTAAAAANQEGR